MPKPKYRKTIPVAVTDEDIDQLRADAQAKGVMLSTHVRKRLNLPQAKRAGRPKKPLANDNG